MAKAEYIISLIKSHYNNEPERFSTVALQIAAHEAKLGHTFVANEIKNIIDKAKETKHKNKILAPDLQGLIQENVPAVNLSNIIASLVSLQIRDDNAYYHFAEPHAFDLSIPGEQDKRPEVFSFDIVRKDPMIYVNFQK